MKKLFIVIEGIDGAGKTTQSEKLKEYFTTQKEPAIISPEPTTGPIGILIRESLKKPNTLAQNNQIFDEQMAYLFAADRHYHLYNEIDGVFTLISKGCHVIVNRYYFSSLAYNADNPKDFEFISLLNQKFPPPDLVIYLDIPVSVAIERLKKRSYKEVYEYQEKLVKVKENYQKIFSEYNQPMLVINNTKDLDLVHNQIVNFIDKIQKKC